MNCIRILFITLLLSLCTISNAMAEKYYNFQYKVKLGDTFASILKDFVPLDSIINAKSPMIIKMRKLNPQVKDWAKLKPGTDIELYIPENMLLMDRYLAYAKQQAQALKEMEEMLTLKSGAFPVGLKGSLFYLASLGIFNQESAEIGNVKFYQNSPVSLGAAFSYYPKEKLYSTSFSAYFSKLLASSNNINTTTASIPAEIGANVFGEYRYLKWNTVLYAGPDFERSTSFNLNSLQNGNIFLEENSIVYLTAGFGKQFTLFDKKWFTKISISKSILSSLKINAPASEISAADLAAKYDGYKVMIYLNYKLSEKLYIHSLLKYHSLSGPSKITTLRIGLGVGYILF